jgi:hypothetical protein
VANSDFEIAAGRTHTAANRYANHTDGPVFAAANPGSTKIPLPNIPPILIAMTEERVKLRFNFFNRFSFIFVKYKNRNNLVSLLFKANVNLFD